MAERIRVTIGDEPEWVTVLETDAAGHYRVVPDGSDEFLLVDNGREPLKEQIENRIDFLDTWTSREKVLPSEDPLDDFPD